MKAVNHVLINSTVVQLARKLAQYTEWATIHHTVIIAQGTLKKGGKLCQYLLLNMFSMPSLALSGIISSTFSKLSAMLDETKKTNSP